MRAVLVGVLGLWLALGVARADEAQQKAQAAFAKGTKLYAVGDYQGALGNFKESYLLFSAPETLYNMAQCQRQLKQHAEAVRLYRNYLELAPQSPDRAEIERTIGEEEGAIASSPPPGPTPPSTPQPRDSSQPPSGLAAPVAVGVVAVAVAAAGLGVYLSARSDYDAQVPGCTPACAPSVLDPISQKAYAGYALLAAAGVVAVVDVALWVVRGLRHRDGRSAWIGGSVARWSSW